MDAEHAFLAAGNAALFLQYPPGHVGQDEGADRVLVLALGFFPMDVYRPADLHGAAVHISPAQADQLPGAQAGENLEAVGVDILIPDNLAAPQRSVRVQQLQQVSGLQYLLAFVPGPGGHPQPFRVEGADLAGPAILAEGPQVCTQGLQRLFAAPGGVCLVDDALQVLFGKAGDPLAPDPGQHPDLPPAGNVLAVAGRGGFLLDGVPFPVQIFHPGAAGIDALIQPGVCLGVGLPLAGAARLRAVEALAGSVLLHVDTPAVAVPGSGVGSSSHKK